MKYVPSQPVYTPMKKYILSISITVLFIAYVVWQRQTDSSDFNQPRAVIPSAQQPVAQSNSDTSSSGSNDTLPQTGTSGQTKNQTANTPSTAQPAPQPAQTPTATAGTYKDGTYTGPSVDAYYGYVQVQAIVSGGKLANVQFLSYPSDRRTSQQINSQAMPLLTREAISAQSANVDAVSGASDTSAAFVESLSAALAQAK